jgi:hypothetical protein
MVNLRPLMRKASKIVAILAAVGVLTFGVSLFSIYEASRLVPEFYHEAISRDPIEQQEARDQFVVQATALASDLHRSGHWQSLFTADQINAWLALELATHYPDLLPDELRDPRISIRDREATIACRYESGGMAAVLSLTVDAYLHEPNVLALRIRRARAGALPVPLAQVLDSISHAARELKLRLEWRKIQGDPVALITFDKKGGEAFEGLNLEAVELREDELFVSGTNGAEHPSESHEPPARERTPTATHEEGSDETQSVLGSAQKPTRQE